MGPDIVVRVRVHFSGFGRGEFALAHDVEIYLFRSLCYRERRDDRRGEPFNKLDFPWFLEVNGWCKLCCRNGAPVLSQWGENVGVLRTRLVDVP